ncbi:MAG: hypothetical protein AAFN27_00210 [Pseudomonadota bacterium]
MQSTLNMINLFKLKQAKHCTRLFNFCCDNWVPQEAIFYLAAERYIFTQNPYMARIFTDVLWLKQGDLALNMQFQDLNVIRRMVSEPEVKVNMGTAKYATMKNRGGMRFGSAGDYNIVTKAIEHCTTHVSQSTILQAQRHIKNGQKLPNDANQAARKAAREYVSQHIAPLLGNDALKKLSVFH